MSMRRRETHSRRSDNVGRRRSREEYRGRHQARRNHGDESGFDEEGDAGGSSGREEFDDDFFAGDEYERIPYQEERYGSRGYGASYGGGEGEHSQRSLQGEEYQEQAQANQEMGASRRGGGRRSWRRG